MTQEIVVNSEFVGKWSAPGGVGWLSRPLLDPEFERAWKRRHPGEVWHESEHKPPFQISWPRLRKLRTEVEDPGAPPIAGRIRGLRIRVNDSHIKNKDVWIYHPDDVRANSEAPSFKSAYQNADRQKNNKSAWCISPREVAKVLGVDPSLVSAFVKKGIPWIPGKQLGSKRKPRTFSLHYGHYGRKVRFWLETETKEFADARKDLLLNPGGSKDLCLQDAPGLSPTQISNLRKKGKIKVVMMLGKNRARPSLPPEFDS
jgi:hypothetical protein